MVALGAALAAVPLLAIDNVSSAEGRTANAASAAPGVLEPSDGSLSILVSRSVLWAQAREDVRQANLSEAISLAEQARREENARAVEVARLAALQDERAKQAAAQKAAAAAAQKAAAAAAARRAAATTTTKAPVKTTVAARPPSGDPTAEQWLKVRQCESSNNYAALSAGGRFRGAYQFSQGTWDWVAALVSPGLVGIDPILAAPGDQDNMAVNLYRMRGASQWPVCGKYLQ